MNNQLPSVKKKSFWRRPEGKLGAFFLIAGAAVIAIYHVPIFSFITSLLKGTISTIALGAVVLALLYMIFDKRVRNLIWYMYKSFMRWITGLFVQIDPAAIGVIILLSLGGAMALPVEVGLSNRHRRNYRPVAELYIARVAYDFEHHDRSTTLETLRALVQESHCSEDARIALQTLLQREDRLSELARDVMFRYSQ